VAWAAPSIPAEAAATKENSDDHCSSAVIPGGFPAAAMADRWIDCSLTDAMMAMEDHRLGKAVVARVIHDLLRDPQVENPTPRTNRLLVITVWIKQ